MAQAATTTVRTIKRDVPFSWEGKDKRGTRVRGKSLAPDEAALRADLRRQGIAPSRIRKQSQSFKSGGRIKPEDIAVFSRRLATMLAAGIPMVQSFEIVGNGRLAFDAFRENRPRMILMDVSMPEMNGFEATAAIRHAEARSGGHTPNIGVTAHALKGDRERCLEAGMDDYLSKPISPQALLEKVERWSWRTEDARREAR